MIQNIKKWNKKYFNLQRITFKVWNTTEITEIVK